MLDMVGLPAIPVLESLRPEDSEFKASVGYIMKSCLE
jgi:hypothetical protein